MDTQHIGVLVYLLPYMEQQNVFNNYRFNGTNTAGTHADFYYQDPVDRPPSTSTDHIPRPPEKWGSNLFGCEPDIQAFLCPSAPDKSNSVTALLTVNYGQAGLDYNAAYGTSNAHVYSSAPGRLIMGRSSYLGVGGYYAPSLYPQYRGFYTYNSKNSIAKTPDGTSNTLMFMEFKGGNIVWGGGGGIPDGISIGSWSSGFNYTGFGTLATNNDQWYLFGSNHAGNIVNTAYGDGSVRTLNTNITFNTLQALAGIADGVVVTGID
jgi:prepilin-type processing-associated H-X9-DG protein